MPQYGLHTRTVLITGGSRGLGLAMAHGFAMEGSRLIIASRDEEQCVSVAAELTAQYGIEAFGRRLHVGEWDTLEPFLEQVDRDVGPVDVLINNAGMSPLYDSLSDVSEALFDKVIGVNLKGPFRLAVLAAERLVAAQRSGSIINISSVGAVRPRPHFLPYAAAKAGLNALTVGLAHEFGPLVRVNGIMAGAFLTDISKAWDPEAFRKRADTYALRRGGQPEEIVGAALYLASEASSYTTGSIITVDGGQP